MSRRMLIDATHPEETRVVVLNGNKLEEFDFETSTKTQIKGNIFLAKVTRVEPSLQAAFIEYGGGRHGFLAFSEIHPDYYQIPVADREALYAAEDKSEPADAPEPRPVLEGVAVEVSYGEAEPEAHADETGEGEGPQESAAGEETSEPIQTALEGFAVEAAYGEAEPEAHADEAGEGEGPRESASGEDIPAPSTPLETVGGDDIEDVQARPRTRHHRSYKIQEVIKRRQILLVQVTKDERGSKGAALTTYLSLAGRYCVLMPNAGRGGGVSRKITSVADRRRLKELMDDLEVPVGMGIIVRTAGSERSKPEIKRDYDYLLRLWNDIRELTLRSSAPALIYEEGTLIKRAIRDLYAEDIGEILIEGETGYRNAKEFMRMLTPGHAARVKSYRDPSIPLFHRFQIDAQIDQIHNPVVQLKSGGYIVINPTEALVSIDVNSGRATRERNIEETATKTNLEAADEIGRQLRLRDLAGLVVIDFIDMDEGRNQRAVEHRLKDAMKVDRARIQLGRISPFGLLELSRQRLRSSLIEASTQTCPHCNGTGTIRSTESTTLVVLRALEEEGIRRRTAEAAVFVPTHVALYLLNQKREALIAIEKRYGFHVTVGQDDSLIPPAFRLERTRALSPEELTHLPAPVMAPVEPEPEDDIAEEPVAAESSEAGRTESDEDRSPRKRRRRRRRGGSGTGETGVVGEAVTNAAEAADDEPGQTEPAQAESQDHPEEAAADSEESGEPRRRRRGRRGGRRHRREGEPVAAASAPAPAPEAPEAHSEQPSLDFDDGYLSPFDFARDGREALFDEKDEAPAEPAAPAAEPVPPPPPPKPRRSRARKPAAEKVELVPVEPEAAETGELAAAPSVESLSVSEVPVSETPVIPAAQAQADEGQPRRSGWWRRLMPPA